MVVWGKRGEICNEYLRKGSSVFVEGRLQSRSWQAQDGSKRTTVEINAQNVQFLSSAGKRGNGSYSSGDYAGNQDVGIDSGMPDYGGESMVVSPDELVPDEDVPF